MAKGIIYVMTTAVSGLIRIGKTGTDQYQERMRNLETNGYYNVVGLKRFFAIELEDHTEKEKLLHKIFNKHQVAYSEFKVTCHYQERHLPLYIYFTINGSLNEV